MGRFKISVVMAVYNVERYIKEAIDSIINQDMGFSSIQLILVNDGSTDESGNICLAYKENYPDNVTYIEKDNGGVSSAKNAGLEHVEGELVSFIDPDDYVSHNMFSEVYRFYKDNAQHIDMVATQLYYFDALNELHGKYRHMGESNRIIDLREEPGNFVLSSASVFYNAEKAKMYCFNENMLGAEDTDYNMNFYLDNPRIGYVVEKDVKYWYRKRKEGGSLVDRVRIDTKGFWSCLTTFSRFDESNLEDYQKEIIIYELRPRLKSIRKELFDDEKDYDALLEEYRKWIRLIDEEFLLFHSLWLPVDSHKVLFSSFKGIDYAHMVSDYHFPVGLNITIRNYTFGEEFKVDLTFCNYGYDVIDVVAFDENQNQYEAGERWDGDGKYNKTFGEFKLDDTHYRGFAFDTSAKTIAFDFIDRRTNERYTPKHRYISNSIRLVAKDGIRYGTKIMTLHSGSFRIQEDNRNQISNVVSTLKRLRRQKKK